MESEPRGIGRPTKYDPDCCAQVEKLCKLGLIDRELAEFLDISEATLNNWKHEHPEFLESIRRGKLVADAEVAEKLYQRATGFEWDENVPIKKKTVTYKDGKRLKESEEIVVVQVHRVVPPDTAAGVHWLTNRQPDRWRNKQQHEVSGKDGAPLRFTLALGDAKAD